jgi:hypothetical protein
MERLLEAILRAIIHTNWLLQQMIDEKHVEDETRRKEKDSLVIKRYKPTIPPSALQYDEKE